MILDQFGRSVGKRNAFYTPRWVMSELARVMASSDRERRVRELRESLNVDDHRVGEMISVKLPARYRDKP